MSIISISLKSRWSHISIIAAALILLTAAGGVFIGVNALKLFNDMRTTWQHFDTVSDQKVTYLTKIHAHLGYSGMAQHLKDYLLHGDEHILTWIDIDLDQAKNDIDSYNLLDITEEEAKALKDLRDLVLKTREHMREIPVLRDEGLTPAQIDTTIDLNPDAAIAALDQLRWAWRQQANETQALMNESSAQGAMLVRLGWVFLPIMLAIGGIVFWLVSRLCKQVAAYEREKAALEESERKFRDMAANVPGVIFQWYERVGGERGYLYVSPRCQELYGVSPDDLKRDWQALGMHPDDEKRYLKTLRDAFERGAEWSFEGRFLTAEGEEKWGRCISKPMPVNDGEIIFNGVMIDISLQKKMEEELRTLATTDSLTGAFNRRHFMHAAESEMSRARRYGKPMGVIFLDIDHFKRINDTFGHSGGDEVLRRFVATVKEHMRSTDILGRIGGEEFALMLPETDLRGAITLAERIRDGIERMGVRWSGETIRVTTSLGVADFLKTDSSVNDILLRADKALYAAKGEGRNIVMVSDGLVDLPARAAPELLDLTKTEPGPHGAN